MKSIALWIGALLILTGCNTLFEKEYKPVPIDKLYKPDPIIPPKWEWDTDQSGHIKFDSDWSVTCRKDEFDDQIYCSTNKGLSFNRVEVSLNKFGISLTFGWNTHPGSGGMVRIGNHKAELFEKSSIIDQTQAHRILDQMLTGYVGVARGIEWPSKPFQFEFSLDGFKEAYEFMVIKRKELEAERQQ